MGETDLPGLTLSDITANLGKQCTGAFAVIAGTPRRESLTTGEFTPQFEKEFCRRNPAELDTIITQLVAKQAPID
jgi:hypothetical protein